MNIDRSTKLFEEAKKHIPGGVNSPARAFLAVDDTPRFIEKADGPFVWDADGNKYLDYILSWGPMILGHNNETIREAVKESADMGLSFGAATEIESKMAELMCQLVPSFEKVRMVTSGTEATMSAIRVARGFTGRDKVIKFVGCYHGHHDALLVKAGSGLLLNQDSKPDSAGVTEGTTKDTILANYNDIDQVAQIFSKFPDHIAAVIVEPVAANMGVVLPEPGFLEGLRELCSKYGAILIFDEVITGFRLALGGAQERFGVTPDMSTFGKIIGGGLPVGAYGGRADIMDYVAPVGSVYQAGTLAGNPIAVAAGLAQLTTLKEKPEIYDQLEAAGNRFFGNIKEMLKVTGQDYAVNHIGSLGSIFFTDQKVRDFDSAKTSDTKEFARYFHHMISNGISIAPSQFEALFLSTCHSKELIDQTLMVIQEFLASS